MKILIVDDEQLARERLVGVLNEADPAFQIEQATNGLDCLEKAQQEEFNVILLDIRMPGMDGLETAQHLSLLKPQPAIIFTTAYQDHAIEAFSAKAVDYLLKPIRRERLLESLERASFINRAHLAELNDSLGDASAVRRYFSVNKQGTIELIPVEEVRCLKADQKYVSVIWPGQESLIDESLKSIETEFKGQFLRVHRNALVALAHIERLEKDTSGSLQIKLRDLDEKIDVSRRHVQEVRKAIKSLQLS
ncbi:MAG: response regulator [Gammaproteobacteria bacterium]|nr:response regulator [Gammaproteobacteria bacterium]